MAFQTIQPNRRTGPPRHFLAAELMLFHRWELPQVRRPPLLAVAAAWYEARTAMYFPTLSCSLFSAPVVALP
jgi:hypothetical protein